MHGDLDSSSPSKSIVGGGSRTEGWLGEEVGEDPIVVGPRLLFAERIAILPSARMAFPVFCFNRRKAHTKRKYTSQIHAWLGSGGIFFDFSRFKLFENFYNCIFLSR